MVSVGHFFFVLFIFLDQSRQYFVAVKADSRGLVVSHKSR